MCPVVPGEGDWLQGNKETGEQGVLRTGSQLARSSVLGNRVPRAVPRVWKATSEERLREGGFLVEDDEEEDGGLGTGRRRMGKASLVLPGQHGQWNFIIYLILVAILLMMISVDIG